jgi:hypothetical protein
MTAINIRRTVDINGAVRLIQTIGQTVTLILLSEPGIGKTSTLSSLAIANGDKWRKVGDHYPDDKYQYCYVDAPNKRDGDMFINMPERQTQTIEQYTTSVVDMNDPRPKVILLDEVFKTLKSMRPLFTRLILERCLGDKPLAKGSIVYATSNNPEDGVGDAFAGHEADRVVFINLRKTDGKTWSNTWAADNGISAITRACVERNPRLTASYMDGVTTADNPYIFHPKTNPTRYASLRSISMADVAVRNRAVLGEELTWAAIEGATNAAYAQLLTSFIALEKELVDPSKPLTDPTGTALPENPAALVLLMYNMVDLIHTQDELSNGIEYIERSDSREMQSVFMSMVIDSNRLTKLGSANRKVQEWMKKNYRIAR